MIAVATGSLHSAALKSDGTVWTWGSNFKWILGDGTQIPSLVPIPVYDPSDPTRHLTGIAAIAIGTVHTVVLRTDGTLMAWGRNYSGQLGDGTCCGDRGTPLPVIDPADPSGILTGITAIDTGFGSSFSLLPDGTALGWGGNGWGQLGDGTNEFRVTPVALVDPSQPLGFMTGVTAIRGGNAYSVASLSNGEARAWGVNHLGQLGDGSTTDRWVPGAVLDPDDPTGRLTGLRTITAGEFHAVAVR